jgi:hypothetical protein
MKPASGPWVSPERREARFHETYRAVCFTTADSPIVTFDDLKREAAARRVKFAFVDPLSVSGGIAPRYALSLAGIEAPRSRSVYTYSHTNVLRHVAAQPAGGRIRVGFAWDDAVTRLPELAGRLRRVPLPTLDRLEIPYDVMAIRRASPRSRPGNASSCCARRQACRLSTPSRTGRRTFSLTAGSTRPAVASPRFAEGGPRQIGAALVHAAARDPNRVSRSSSQGAGRSAHAGRRRRRDRAARA